MGIKSSKDSKSSKSSKTVKEEKVKKSSKSSKSEKPSKEKKSKSSKEEKVKKSSKIKTRTKKVKEVEVVKPIKEKMKATDLIEHLVEATELDRKQVKLFLEELSNVIKGCVVKKGCGEFTFPKLFKIRIKDMPAKKARKGISPFTGEETVFKAKPASRKVKILPMKTLKDIASPPKD